MTKLSKTKTRIRPIGECKRCSKQRVIVLSTVMICQPCYKIEPKAYCGVCGWEKRFVTDGAGICPDCIKRISKRDSRPTEIECAKCGKTKPPAKPDGDYCKLCQRNLDYGHGRCSGCGKDKPYRNKRDNLCGWCYVNRLAPRSLRRYLERVSITNEYNLTLFRHLTALINWERVNEEDRLRFSDFGKFLQSHQFEGPLSWASILKLNSELSGAKFRCVRSCLEQLGEILLDPAEKETLDESARRSKPLVPIAGFQDDVIALLKEYDLWLRTERTNTPKARSNHFETLAALGAWCGVRGLTLISAAEGAYVEEFLHTLGLKWKCRHCSFTKNLTIRGEAPPNACENIECRALHSYEKVIRCKQSTVRGHRGRLRVFFGWLKDVEKVSK